MFLEEQLDKVGRDENSWYACTGGRCDGLVDTMAAELKWGRQHQLIHITFGLVRAQSALPF